MTKKIGDKPVKGIKSTKDTKEVTGADEVSGVGDIKPASGVTGVGRAGAVRGARLTRVISIAEREQIFRMIKEEADELVSKGAIPEGKRAVVETAVKMALDSAMVEGDDDEEDEKKKPKDK